MHLQDLHAPGELSYEIDAYNQWLQKQTSDPGIATDTTTNSRTNGKDYLFSSQIVRFEPRAQDVVMASPDLVVREDAGIVSIYDPQTNASVPVNVTQRQANVILDAIDGRRCLAEIMWQKFVEKESLSRFLRACFGLIVFSPDAILALQDKIAGWEITRFVGSPYEIERNYWNNMGDMRQAVQHLLSEMKTPDRLRQSLKKLHIIALMGRNWRSYYKPASPASDYLVAPGTLYTDEPKLQPAASHMLFVHGPRVNVTFLGGQQYHRALAESVNDPMAVSEQRNFCGKPYGIRDRAVNWGQFVTARATKDKSLAPWFCPPRPMTDAHWEVLATHLAYALDESETIATCNQEAKAAGIPKTASEDLRKGASERVVHHVARFHQSMVRLHPFQCANQCLAMNLVNTILNRAEIGGIPHLVLDHLALRLHDEAYEKLFQRAVSTYATMQDSTKKRFAKQISLRNAYYRFVQACQKQGARVQDLIEKDPIGARAALVIP